MERHFVTFFSPGTFVPEQTIRPIDSWDVAAAVEMARGVKERYGATPYAFQFSTRSRGPEDLDSRESARSHSYFLGGDVLTLAQIKARNDPRDKTIIANMESNQIERVVENRNSWRAMLPLEDGDTVLDFTP